MSSHKPSDPMRRDFIKKAAYVAPVILTLQAVPALAQVGSGAPVSQDRSFGEEAAPAVTPERIRVEESRSPASAPNAKSRWPWVKRLGGRSIKPWQQRD